MKERRVIRGVLAGVAAAGLLAVWPASARAQSAAPSGMRGFLHRVSIGAIGGAGAVQNIGGLVGGELSITLTGAIDIFGEGLGIADVVTRRRGDRVPVITSYLQASQGKPASGSVTAPAGYGGAGIRVALTKHRIRPYIAFSAGAAKVAYTPAFTLAGTDVTRSLAQYDVQLGRDITGEVTAAAFGGGGGIRTAINRWYLDGGVRLTSIRTPDEPTNVLRAEARFGLRF